MTLADEYRLIREGAAIGATAPRQQIALTGKDRASYLQGLLTNDIEALTAGTGCYAAWLTPQGRMLTDMHVLESETLMLLDVPAATAATTRDRLEQFIFSEDVQVAMLSEQLDSVWVHGPAAAAALERTLTSRHASGTDLEANQVASLATWGAYRHAQFWFAAAPVSVARIDQLGVPGYCVYVERALAAALTTALESAGAVSVSEAAIDAARVEAAYPLFGQDMNDEIIPLEAGIEGRAISFSKGCYVGQEIVIRVLHRGQGRVAKKLVPLRFSGVLPDASSRLHAGDKDIGYVTSVAQSPHLGPIGLGYVHRDFTAPGTVLREGAVAGPAEG
jgi:folate-binding protein YgfZ